MQFRKHRLVGPRLGTLLLLALLSTGCRLTDEDRGLVERVGDGVARNELEIRAVSESLATLRDETAVGRTAEIDRIAALESRVERMAHEAAAERTRRSEELAAALGGVSEAVAALDRRQGAVLDRIAQVVDGVRGRLDEVAADLARHAEEDRAARARIAKNQENFASTQAALAQSQDAFAKAAESSMNDLRARTDRSSAEQKQGIQAALGQLEKLGGNATALTARQEAITNAVQQLDAALARLAETQARYEAQVREQVDRIAKQDGQAMETLRLGTAARLSAIETELQESRAALMQQGEELIPTVRELRDRLAKVESIAMAALDESRKATVRATESPRPDATKKDGSPGESVRIETPR